MKEIISTSNPLVKTIKSLKDKEARFALNEFIVEGENIVKDLPAFVKVDYVFVEDKKVSDFKYILDRYNDEIIYCVSSNVMKAISDTQTPPGILVVVQKPKMAESKGNVVVLDGISDPGNMGTIIRTCVACGIKDIYAISTVDAFSPKVVRSTMGGIFQVNIIPTTYDELFNKLQGYDLLTLDMYGKDIFEENKITEPFALVVGSEAHGVSKILKEKCTTLISLPMVGQIESLNAAVSLSVALYTLTFRK